jgi:hypothetical protein
MQYELGQPGKVLTLSGINWRIVSVLFGVALEAQVARQCWWTPKKAELSGLQR